MTSIGKDDFENAADEIMARIERDGAIHKSSLVAALAAVAAAKWTIEVDKSVSTLAQPRMQPLDPGWKVVHQSVSHSLRGVSGGKLLIDAGKSANKTMVDSLARGLRDALESERQTAPREISADATGKWTVSRHLGNGRVEYLYADLKWRPSLLHQGQSTGYFCTFAVAKAAMLRDNEEERKKRAGQKGATP
jgi:hypothetical protein